MGQAVPEDDLPGSLVPANDLPEGPIVPEGSISGSVAPQMATVGSELAKEVPGAVRVGGDLVKQGAQALAARPLAQSVADIAGLASHGIPWGTIAQTAMNTNPTTLGQAVNTAKDILKAAPGAVANGAGRVGGALVRGALAPESAVLMPYQMAAYEQEKIRANPNAAEYAKNPYAQAYRGEYATQRAAGAANARQAVAAQASGYTPNPQEARNLLDSGDERTINLYGGRLKLEGLASPGPNAIKSGYTQELKRLGR